MEDNLILEGLLSMVTEMKEKLEAQVTPASREETLERFGAIEQALSRLHSNPAVPVEKLQTIQSQLDDVRNKVQGHFFNEVLLLLTAGIDGEHIELVVVPFQCPVVVVHMMHDGQRGHIVLFL